MHLIINILMRARTGLLTPLFGRRLLSPSSTHSKSIFFLTCRIHVGENDEQRKYRATYLVRRPRYVEAEGIAEKHLQDFLQQHSDEFGAAHEIRWLKGRLVSAQPRLDESTTTLRLLSELRKGDHEFVTAIERVDTAHAQ